MKHHRLSFFLLVISLIVQLCLAGHRNKHGGNNRLIELLTAGIVAKVLQKNDGHEGGGGGGGGGYYTIPIPLHMGSQRSHSHVTEKIIPIPIPHHTTRIIHINAGSGHGGGEGGFDHHGGGGYGDHHGGDGYGNHHGGGGGGGGYEEPGHYDGPSGDHHDDHHSHRSPTIQQLMFHDNGVYGMPQPPRPPMPPHLASGLMRRPMVGMMPLHPAMPMGMMPPYPLVSAAQAHPAVGAARPPAVRVRHYYPLATVPRHRFMAYPTMPQLRYHPIPPRPW